MSKRFCWIFIIVYFTVIFSFLYFNHISHEFSPEKWKNQPESREKITEDLFESYEVIGMTESEVTALLGDDYMKGEYFIDNLNDKTYDLKNNIVYYIGSYLLERIYLILHLEDGIVSGYTYGVKT